ncbi:hypothetical protein I302_104109 [Kwoniella bestiolae CBS 10118]|uniref:Phenazine biosynthesis protein n=1 Tax=Kwoniella bestiolae CBS 10118 TaxID=1296100 RepID=A0A1B9GAC0_9TREE|nr:hypothetical protein I302_02817 [Kwoniella bestiolae CBS 10118]OCF27967.1 hypothetical protein I302_02817 [Kwoniella bestiolae CBS 10118]
MSSSHLPPLPFHVLSAFAPTSGTGSQAALVIYPSNTDPRWLDDRYLLKVAGDFGYTATVHLAPSGKEGEEGEWEIRWFTAKSELALCGHGTISTSYILFQQYPHMNTLRYINPIAGRFQSTRLEVPLSSSASSSSSNEVEISLPSLPQEVLRSMGSGTPHEDGKGLRDALGVGEDEVLDISEFKYGVHKSLIVLVKGEVGLRELQVDIRGLGEIASGQIIITQISPESESSDNLVIKSRMFAPGIGIQEDTITGSAHTYLTNYYLLTPASRFLPHKFQQNPSGVTIQATQLSERGGGMKCILGEGNRTVRLIGKVREFGKGFLVDDDDV